MQDSQDLGWSFVTSTAWPRDRLRFFKRLVIAIGCVGFTSVAQAFPIHMGGNVHFITGTILAWIFLRVFGVWVGLACATAASLWTIHLWGHPFGAITTGLEFVFVLSAVGLVWRYWPKASAVSLRPIAILGYWLGIGIPLVTVFYTTQLGLGVGTSVAIGFKQAVNGSANMFIAEGLLVIALTYSGRFRRWSPRKLGSGHLMIYTGGLIGGAMAYLTVAFLSDYLLNSLYQAQMYRLQDVLYHAEQSLVSQRKAGDHLIALLNEVERENVGSDVKALLRRGSDGQWEYLLGDELDRDQIVADANLGVGNSFNARESFHIAYLGEWAIIHSLPVVDNVQVALLRADEVARLQENSSTLYPSTLTSLALTRQRDKEAFGIMRGMELGSDWVIGPPNGALGGSVAVSVPSSFLLSQIWRFQLRLTVLLFVSLAGGVAILSIVGRKLSDQATYITEEIVEPRSHSVARQLSGPFLTYEAQIAVETVRDTRKALDDAFNAAVLEGRALIQITDEMRVYLVRIVGGEVVIKNRRFADDFQDEEVRSRILSGLVRVNLDAQGHWRFTQTEKIDGRDKLISWDVTCTDEGRGAYTVTGFDVTEEQSRLEKVAFESKLAGLGTLAAGFAHEINQPLNVIMMANSNLTRRLRVMGGDEVALEKTARIGQQVKRASSFVQNLRRIAKTAMPESQVEHFSLSQTINSTIDLVQNQYALQDIGIERNIEAGLIALGSETLLDQVLINLLTNAHDALVERGQQNMHIWVSTRAADDKLWVEVLDNGGGIPKDVIDRIFDPFFTTKESGTGLGLSLSRQIMSSIGGSLDVANTEVGARFVLELQRWFGREGSDGGNWS
jgi:signal transduction histidine kinase